jgi:ketosteroid isomerase-like protein
MSQENVELVHRFTAAINRHDIDAALALMDPDVKFIPRLVEVDGGGSFRGHDGVRSWWENLFGVWPDFKSEVEEVRELGDVTLTRARFSGQGTASEAATEQTSWVVNEWRDGKVIWMRVFPSEGEALEAAGLRE